MTIEILEQEALTEIQAASSTTALRELELKYLGKNGLVSGLMKGIGTLTPEERPAYGQKVNLCRAKVQETHDTQLQRLKAAEREVQFQHERIDVTLPSRPLRRGREHVLGMTMSKIKRVLGSMGFVYYDGPELEDFDFNFSELNYPPDHPAMDAQDTFYITDETLLRTQCTAIQGRVFGTVHPPLRYFTVGRTFRNEAVDRTHSHTFHQVDCFMVDEGISMAHLKGTLGVFARAMFGPEVKVRFRPDFFPFVEPGVDYAISSPKLFGGKWVELGGAGLIHPNILERHGIDTERYTGFAFGLGVERIPMMAYGIDDLRNFMENDLRFLEQYS
ncbi:MAG: phenylalanine--tRNA ligase subunit alpha [Fimbriimonadaceae bacterium]|jgi:phenylalanyl-tRNA synthetase alpha chain|nr:phenylalanine--tRNA ligase subunit alpha [Fimbriimonadaceae bacterium]